MSRLFSKRLYLAVALISVVATLILIVVTNPVIRIVVGVPFVLILPGFALTSALFTRRELKVAERLVYTLGLSLAVTALSGLLLNLTPQGLQPETWAALLGTISCVASLVAFRRRQDSTIAPAAPASFSLSIRQMVLLALTGAVTLVALALAFAPTPQQSNEGYTNLWIQPGGSDKPARIQLGVESLESAPMQYRLEVKAADRLVRIWPRISLAPGEKFTDSLDLATTTAGNSTLEGDLYRLDNPNEVYRRVILRPDTQP